MIDFKELLKAGVHFGHKTSFGNPKMRPYIWGAKNRIHLIDISKTATLLEYAGKMLKNLTSTGGSILWVGTKKPAQAIIQKTSIDLNMPFVINRWIGGTLSNYGQVKKAITHLLHLRDVLKKTPAHYTKKETVMLQKQLDRLEKNVGGIIDLTYPPAAIVVVDAKKEHSAVKEAFGMGIPVFALVDTNTDPSFVTYLIPANDDSPRSIKFIIDYLAKCTAEGQKLANQTKATEEEEKEKATKNQAPLKTKKSEKEIISEELPPKKATTKDESTKTKIKKVSTPKTKSTQESAPKIEKKETPKKSPAKKIIKKSTTKK